MPVSVVDSNEEWATLTNTQRKVFRNPRGLKYYYVFCATDTGLKLFKSADGVSWSLVSTINPTLDLCCDCNLYDDGTQLIAYLTYGSSQLWLENPIFYRRLIIPDDQSDPIIGAEQVVVPST